MDYDMDQMILTARKLHRENTFARSYQLAFNCGLLRRDEFLSLRANGYIPYERRIVSIRPI